MKHFDPQPKKGDGCGDGCFTTFLWILGVGFCLSVILSILENRGMSSTARLASVATIVLVFVGGWLLWKTSEAWRRKEETETQEELQTQEEIFLGETIDYGFVDSPEYSKAGDLVWLPASLLNKAILLLGDMGVGKTRFLKALYDYLREFYPKIPIIIHDPKSEWTRAFYDPEKSLIFSPYDTRSVGWNLWKDLEDHPELADLICKSAILAHQKEGNDPIWVSLGASLLSECLEAGDILGMRQKLLEKKSREQGNKTFLSSYTTAKASVRDIVSISLKNSEGSLTMDDFIASGKPIFLLNPPAIRESNSGALNIFLTALLARLVSLKNTAGDLDLRAAFLIDEALQFNLPETIEEAVVTTSRHKGLVFVGGIQNLPEKWRGETHLTKAQTKIIFRCSHPATAEEVSRWSEIEYEKEVITGTPQYGDPASPRYGERAHIEKRHGRTLPKEALLSVPDRAFFLRTLGDMLVVGMKDVELSERDEIDALIFDQPLKKAVNEYMGFL